MQIHQPITYDYFEHQQITDKMGGTCGLCVKTIKRYLSRKILNYSAGNCFQESDSQLIKGFFYTSYKKAISIQIPMLKVNNFL